MQDRPTAAELLAAVRAFLETDVAPTLEGRRKFHTLVAANVLAIVEREITGEEASLLAEWSGLAALLKVDTDPTARIEALRANTRAMTVALAAQIRVGAADEDDDFGRTVRAHLRAVVTEKLRVANPKFAR